MKLETMIANSVSLSLKEDELEKEATANEVTASVKKAIMKAELEDDDASPIELVEGDKVAYYVERTCEELANKIKDIRFESNNAFSYGRSNITNVVTDDDNTTKVTVVQSLEVAATRDTKAEVDGLIAKFRQLAIPPKYASYVSVSSAPGIDGTSVDLTIVFNLPVEYIQVIGAEDYLKRNAVVSKEIKKLVDNYLG